MQLLAWERASPGSISQTKTSNQNEIIVRYVTYRCFMWVSLLRVVCPWDS